MKRTKVYLAQIGEFLPLKLEKFASRLNGKQEVFEFRVLSNHIPIAAVREPAQGVYYTEKQLLPKLREAARKDKIPESSLVMGVTSLRITTAETLRTCAEQDADWLAIWASKYCRIGRPYHNLGITSVALWMRQYEGLAFRTVDQFVAYMLVAFFGDRLFKKTLTHADFRWCVFDLNDDLDSIAESVRKARIHEDVKNQIRNAALNTTYTLSAGNEELLNGFNDILKWVRRPGGWMVLRYFHENAVTSVFLLGLLLSLAIQDMFEFVKPGIWLSGIMIGVFALLVYWHHRWPSGRLG